MDKVVLERLKFVSFFMGLSAVIFLSASCAGNAWLKKDQTSNGLWKECTVSKCVSIDTQLMAVPDWLMICRVFVILSCVTGLVGIVLLLVLRTLISGIFSLLSSLFMVVGMSLYIDKVSVNLGTDVGYGWSADCGWLGTTCVFLAGVFALLGTDGFVERIQKIVQYVVLVGSASITLLFIITCASESWRVSGYYSKQGLWRYCTNLYHISLECRSISSQSIKFIRAFVIMSWMVSASGCVLSALSFRYVQIKKFYAPSFLLYAGINMIIGLSYYTYLTRDETTANEKYGWSYMIGWIGSFLALLVGFIGLTKDIFLRSRVTEENADNNIHFERIV